MEKWKDIQGYEGEYQVSNHGRIKSLKYEKEKILKEVNTGLGYKGVNLYKDGKIKHYTIHRLVAINFIPNPGNLPQVNHKDEDKTNNHINNLEWCSIEYNNNYGTRLKKISKNNSKKKKVKCVNTGETFESVTKAAKWANTNRGNITKQIKGIKYKTAGKHPITGEKLRWEYK